MDRLRRQNDLRSERMVRRIEEATASGMSVEDAFELAMQEEGLSIPRRDASDPSDSVDGEPVDGEPKFDDSNLEEPWLESLPRHPFDEGSERSELANHPVVDQAQSFLMTAMDLANEESNPSSFISVLTRASMDMVGGLVQATSDSLDDNLHRALAITQLKRALSGHAFARGAIFGLRSEEVITQEQSTQLHNDLESLLINIHELAETAWS